MVGNIDELKALAQKLATDDGTKNAKILSNKMFAAIPRFEGSEEVSFLPNPIYIHTDTRRNANDVNTVKHEEISSSAQQKTHILCTKVEHEESV